MVRMVGEDLAGTTHGFGEITAYWNVTVGDAICVIELPVSRLLDG